MSDATTFLNQVSGNSNRTISMLSNAVSRHGTDDVKKGFSSRLQGLVSVLVDETASLPDFKEVNKKAELFDVMIAQLTNETKALIYEKVRSLIPK